MSDEWYRKTCLTVLDGGKMGRKGYQKYWTYKPALWKNKRGSVMYSRRKSLLSLLEDRKGIHSVVKSELIVIRDLRRYGHVTRPAEHCYHGGKG